MKQKMLQAQELLKQKRYDEARAILETVDHPTAHKWLAKLDEIAPVAPRGKGKSAPKKGGAPAAERSGGSALVRMLVILLVVVIIGAVGVVVVPRFLPSATSNTGGTGGAASAPIGSGQAQIAVVNTLAKYFPADTVLYGGTTTDDATIDTLDSVVNKVITKLPPGVLPAGVTFSLKTFLDQTSQQYLGGDFKTSVRSWLGTTAAVGMKVGKAPGSQAVLMAIAITNKDEALKFIDSLAAKVPGMKLNRSEESGYTVFTIASNTNIIAVGSDVILIADSKETLPLVALPSPNLADDAAFQATVKLLPAPSYNAVVYLNTSQLLKLTASNNPSNPQMAAITKLDVHNILGLTILDGRSLIMDTGQHISDLTPLKEQGITLDLTGPVDPNFLANVPANASLVMHGTNLKAVYDFALKNAKSQSQSPASTKSIDDTLIQVDQQLNAMTGLKLQDDILSWLTGDYAFFLSYAPPAPGTPPVFVSSLYPDQKFDLGMEFGFILKATDPAKAKNLVEGIAKPLTQMGSSSGVQITRETIGGANAIVISAEQPSLTAPLQIVIAANDNVLVIGTRQAAAGVLGGSGGFPNAPAFNAAKAYLLPDATTVWYADTNAVILVGDGLLTSGPAINNIFQNIVSELNNRPAPKPDLEAQRKQVQDMQQNVRNFAALFSSATLSTAGTANGDAVVRFVLTLAE